MNILGISRVPSRSIFWSKLLGTSLFAVLLCFSSLIKIPLPFTPVPITLQNLVVFLAGAMLGPSCGMASVAVYIALGISGIPLFANTGFGLAYLFGPTGGYLLGFLAAAGLIGYLTEKTKTKNILILYAVMLFGMAVVYGAGGCWLKIGYGWSFKEIFFLGVSPFLLPDMMKAFVAAVMISKR